MRKPATRKFKDYETMELYMFLQEAKDRADSTVNPVTTEHLDSFMAAALAEIEFRFQEAVKLSLE